MCVCTCVWQIWFQEAEMETRWNQWWLRSILTIWPLSCSLSGFTFSMYTFLPEHDYAMFGSLLSSVTFVRPTQGLKLSVIFPHHFVLSSVTFVCPTQGVETFGGISSPFCTLAVLWPPCKILWKLFQGNRSAGGVKRKRGIAACVKFGYLSTI